MTSEEAAPARPGVHPTAVVGPGVELGVEVTVGPHAVLLGPLRIGDRCWIGPGVVIGTPPEVASLPQNAAWTGDLTHHGVEIGDDTVVRELSTIHQGSHRPTRVGSRCWLLNRSYLAHDVQVGDDVTVSAGVSIGGHALVGRFANLGMNAAVHQRRVVGPGAMVGMSTAVARDVPPFAKVFGSPVRVRGVNGVGARRAGHDASVVEVLAVAYGAGDTALTDTAGVDALGADLRWWLESGATAPTRSGDAA